MAMTKLQQKKVLWGILGTGSIARVFASGLKCSTTGELYAIGSRSLESAQTFAREFDVQAIYDSYDKLLEDLKVDAVYIALPHPLHAEWAIKAAVAGKHILCEKPIAMTYDETLNIISAARSNDVFLMEGYMYRCHPQTSKLVELIKENRIGDVRVIQATFSFHANFDNIALANQKMSGGGGIMDVGGYPISMARLIAGVARGQLFSDPVEVYGAAHIGDISHIDEWVIGSLKFEGGILAQVAAGTRLVQENTVKIFGSKGTIFIPSPWVPGGRDPGTTKILVHKNGEKYPEEIFTSSKIGLYALEADIVAENLDNRQAPVMTWDDTIGNMKTLERWRKAVGVSYS
uniref:Gfo/Idh/MocA family protein n=1 Tax=Algoriphagus sp. TaxID=1872435 RepID=UPI0040477418